MHGRSISPARGARSWPALVHDAQARAVARGERARTLVDWATSARRVEAEALLALDPGPARETLDGGDAVVGAASFLLHGETVLGQQLAVVAPERRAGIGRALVRAAAREAMGAGARVALVGPTPDTVAFYRLLGLALRPWPRDRSFYLPGPR